ncbi:hypothetical protein HDU86_006944 [Geranomyces michiganensis]|nr:hypothetical protein HDU86_006944 [Geranomyces michiganensis]
MSNTLLLPSPPLAAGKPPRAPALRAAAPVALGTAAAQPTTSAKLSFSQTPVALRVLTTTTNGGGSSSSSSRGASVSGGGGNYKKRGSARVLPHASRKRKLGRFRPRMGFGAATATAAAAVAAANTTTVPANAPIGLAPSSPSASRKLNHRRRRRPPLPMPPPPPPRRKGDFYRPASLLRRETANANTVNGLIAHSPPLPLLPEFPSAPPPHCDKPPPPCLQQTTPAEVDLEELLDDVFADLAAGWASNSNNNSATNDDGKTESSQDESDEMDYDAEDFCTPPLAGWLYPDESYAADRRKFSDVGGTTLDRTFIGMPVPENVLDGVDSRL